MIKVTLLLLCLFLFFPFTVFASNEFELKQVEEDKILQSLIQGVYIEFVENCTSINNFSIKEEVILAVLGNSVKFKTFNSIIKEATVMGIKAALEAAVILISQDPAIVIKEIEKLTANAAKEYATDWFLQKEIKVGNGNFNFYYRALDTTWEAGKFPYIIVYKPLSVDVGEVLISVYSVKEIKTPDQILMYQWEGGIEKIPPFILQIKGEVKKNNLGAYSWIKKPGFKFIFDQPVPKLEFKEPTIIDRIKSQANRAIEAVGVVLGKGVEKVKKVATEIKSSWDKLGLFLSNFKLFGGTLANAPVLSSDWQEVSIEDGLFIEEESSAFTEGFGETKEEPIIPEEPRVIIKTVTADNQAEIDELKKELEIFRQKLNELSKLAENMREEEQKEEQEKVKVEVVEAAKAVKKTSTRSGGSTLQLPSYCNFNDADFIPGSVIFGEIGWLGNGDSANNEWVELRNITGNAINLEGWQVLDKDLQVKTVFPAGKTISSYGVFLMERTDDNSVLDRTADYIYTGALNNDDEVLYLFNNSCVLQDRETNVILNEINNGSILSAVSESNSEIVNILNTVSESNEEIITSPAPPAPPKILINEIAWMGTKAYAVDEWIELYNPNEEAVDLTGWSISGSINVNFSVLESVTPIIEPLGYFLMERTDDTTISDIKADKIYTGALNDDSGIIELKDGSGNLVDKADFPLGWIAGNKQNRISTERFDENTWRTNNLLAINGKDMEGSQIFGTPRAKNSVIAGTYIIDGGFIVPVGETLTIEPGSILKFTNEYATMIIDGTLKAVGTEKKKIIFTSLEEDKRWRQIYFRETSVDSEISYAIIENGGGDPSGTPCSDNMAGIKIEKTNVSLKNLIIKNNLRRGVFLVDSNSIIDGVEFSNNPPCHIENYYDYGGYGIEIRSGSPEIKNSSFKNHITGIWAASSNSLISSNNFEENQRPIVSHESFGPLSGNTAQNNDLDGIFVMGNIMQSTEWKKDLPYIISDTPTIAIGVSLTINAGVTVKFYDLYDGLWVDGDLKVMGEEGNEVIFTSIKEAPAPGDWDKIEINSSSANSEINNAVIEYAGGGYGTPCNYTMSALKINGANVKLNNLSIKNTQYRGVYLIGSPTVLDDSVHIENTTKCMDTYGGVDVTIE